MAYMSQEKKKMLAPQIKAVLKKYGVKATISVSHHSTLVVTLREGPFDIIAEYNKIAEEKGKYAASWYMDVNPYWIDDNHAGEIRDFLNELKDAMNGKGAEVKNHNNSNPMTDYFDVGWYIRISVGRYDKPYKVI